MPACDLCVVFGRIETSAEPPIKAVCPNMCTSGGIDELSGDAHLIAFWYLRRRREKQKPEQVRVV